MRVGCLWNSSHDSSFLRRRRSSYSVGFLCCNSPFVKLGPRGRVDGARVADRSRAPRNPLVGAYAPLSAGTRLSVSRDALASAWFSLAERRLLVQQLALGKGVTMTMTTRPVRSLYTKR